MLAAGPGDDPSRFDGKYAENLRIHALAWLRSYVRAGNKLIANGPSTALDVSRRLKKWQEDPQLATVREPAELAELRSAERQAWQQLWSDVEKLRQLAEEHAPKMSTK